MVEVHVVVYFPWHRSILGVTSLTGENYVPEILDGEKMCFIGRTRSPGSREELIALLDTPCAYCCLLYS
jgi:hypothetical protein